MPTANGLARPDSTIVLATPKHTRFIRSLARDHANAIGFIPDAGLDKYVENRHVLLCLENGEPAGYLLGRPHLRWQPLLAPITQAAICFDAQRRHHGLALVDELAAAAAARGQIAMQAICRHGLDANHFWRAAGFTDIGSLYPWTSRRKELIVWRRPLTNTRPLWFDFLPPVAGHKGRRTL